MPETYGLPEPEPTREERVENAVAQVVAGQGIVRRILLYVAVAVLMLLPPLTPLSVVPLILLMATDKELA